MVELDGVVGLHDDYTFSARRTGGQFVVSRFPIRSEERLIGRLRSIFSGIKCGRCGLSVKSA